MRSRPARGRRPHLSLSSPGTLLKAQGDLDGAAPLLREALEACRGTLGDGHPDTLGSIYNLGLVLEARGELDGAAALFAEELAGCKLRYGAAHQETLSSARHLIEVLQAAGTTSEAAAIASEYGLVEPEEVLVSAPPAGA